MFIFDSYPFTTLSIIINYTENQEAGKLYNKHCYYDFYDKKIQLKEDCQLLKH